MSQDQGGKLSSRLPDQDWTCGSLLDWAEQVLRHQGIEGPRQDARLLLSDVCECSLARLIGFPEDSVSQKQAQAFAALIQRRANHEPVSRLLGTREFWSLPFGLNAHTLDPRPDTETLVEAVLARVPDPKAPLTLLDLGTGSGCILLALLSELPNVRGIGLDIAPQAVEQAAANAQALALDNRAEFKVSNWVEALGPDLSRGLRFDWVVSNPPYIESSDLTGLAPEVVNHDPLAALDGGQDGFDAYREIVSLLPKLLSPGGKVAFEHGAGQSAELCRLLERQGLTLLDCPRDLSGLSRCVLAEFPA
ncbi:peptide chain release factor N(5)-glutamine methyltransferase [Rhodovibrionaceae bacterium A322]